MRKAMFGCLIAAVGLLVGWVGGVHHIRQRVSIVYATTGFAISDFGNSILLSGVMTSGTSNLSYPGNGFQAVCTPHGCDTFVAVAQTSGSGTMLLTTKGFGTVVEFSPERVVFKEDGGVLSIVLGEHRSFTYTLDRQAKSLRAMGRADESTADSGMSAVLELRRSR